MLENRGEIMAKVIGLRKAREARQRGQDLTDLVKSAAMIKGRIIDFREDLKKKIIIAASQGQFKVLLSALINEAIFRHPSLICRESLLCGIYSAQVLTQFIFEAPKSWWAVDCLVEHAEAKSRQKSINALKRGGDLCFLICSVFPERGNIRIMTLKDYQTMGVGFFQRHFNSSGAEISNFMSQQFGNMATIIQGHILPELKGER